VDRINQNNSFSYILLLDDLEKKVPLAKYGRLKPVALLKAALGTISKTIKLAGLPNPIHKAGTTHYHAVLTMQIEFYKPKYPMMIKQLAIPVDVPNYIYCTTRKAFNCRIKTIREVILIAFYFLLGLENIHIMDVDTNAHNNSDCKMSDSLPKTM